MPKKDAKAKAVEKKAAKAARQSKKTDKKEKKVKAKSKDDDGSDDDVDLEAVLAEYAKQVNPCFFQFLIFALAAFDFVGYVENTYTIRTLSSSWPPSPIKPPNLDSIK